MRERLTKRQRKTVLKYRRMAYWYVKRNPSLVAEYGLQDANQNAMLLLCYAAKKYDPKRVAKSSGTTVQFTTFLYSELRWGFIDLFRSRGLRTVTMAKDDLAHMVSSGSIERIRHPDTVIDTYEISRIEAEERSELVETLLSATGIRERRILELRFGFDDGECKTLEETGNRLRITKERVRQIQMRGMRQIENYIDKMKAVSPSGEWP